MRALTLVSFALSLIACDGDPPAMDAGGADAGPPDSGPPDSGPPFTCAEMTNVEVLLDDTVTLMLDTRTVDERPRDLGVACGNVEGEVRWPPQQVLALQIPGDGFVAVELDTLFDETELDFNTVLQVREACETVPPENFPPSCFDNAGTTEYRSQGWFTAMGGETLYLIVTGYAETSKLITVDQGPLRLDITARETTLPVLESGTFRLALDDIRVQLTGTDPDRDVRGMALNFYNATGLLDIYGDGQATEDGDVFLVFFNQPASNSFTVQQELRGEETNVGPYLRNVNATRVGIRLFDEGWGVSETLMLDIEESTYAGLGGTCDWETVCRAEMSCIGGECGVGGLVERLCNGASPIAVTADGMPVTRTGTTGPGFGAFAPLTGCTPVDGSIGAEAIYTVTVPEGTTADLILTTDTPENGATDTIVYVRSICADSASQLGCNDNRAATDPQSDVTAMDLAAGQYFVFVERWGGLASGSIGHGLRATLRPVLASGVSCDPAGTLNRCATGVCTEGLCP